MLAVEFHARIVEGKIEIPSALRDRVTGEVGVILFSEGADRDPSAWPEQNRRRWELIAQKAKRGLSDAEAAELASLQSLADKQLAAVGRRPSETLEQLWAELSEE